MATLKYFKIIIILIFISYTGGGAANLAVSSFVLSINYYSGMEQFGSSSASYAEGRGFKSHSPQYFVCFSTNSPPLQGSSITARKFVNISVKKYIKYKNERKISNGKYKRN